MDEDSIEPGPPVALLLDDPLLLLGHSLDSLLLLLYHLHETVEVTLQDFLFFIDELLLGWRCLLVLVVVVR